MAASWTSSAQTIQQSQYWIRYFNQLKISERIVWNNEIDERRYFNPDQQAQLIIHSHIHYQARKKFDIGAGLSFSSATVRNTGLEVPEWRPFQELTFTQPFSKKVNVQFRNRFDERFIHNSNGESLDDGYFFVFRNRTRMQFQFVIPMRENKNISIRLFDEYMIQFSKKDIPVFDQNRVQVAVEYPWNKVVSTEISYVSIYQSRGNTGHFNRDVIRFTFYHRLRVMNTKA